MAACRRDESDKLLKSVAGRAHACVFHARLLAGMHMHVMGRKRKR